MTEDFLYYIWQHKLFYSNNLTLSNGESLTIITTGIRNNNSGPDFLNAKIKISNFEWAGNVEIHTKSSDWQKHNHNVDSNYDNIILHVVFENDKNVLRKSGEVIPTLELKNKFNELIYEKYKEFLTSQRWIPCEYSIKNIERFHFEMWLERMLIERIENKIENIQQKFDKNINNWEQTFYEHLCSSFGLKVNSVAFEVLAKSIPISILAKHKNNLFQIEAMLFGQAGMLGKDFKDEYPKKLKNEYKILQAKYNFEPISNNLWKFMRMRPSNFPTIRIAQIASLIFNSSALFSKIINSKTINEIKLLFDIQISDYWKEHYSFDKKTKVLTQKIGELSLNLIMINTIVPFLYFYGKYYDNEDYTKRALYFMDLLPEENNSIIRKFKELNINTSTSYRTQALLHLKKEYCDKKRCLECAIGNILIKNVDK